MVRSAVFVVLASFLIVLTSFAQTLQKDPPTVNPNERKPASAPQLIAGIVSDVNDGESMVVRGTDGTLYTVRLQAVDAPEPKQDSFKRSRSNLSAMVLDKAVRAMVQRVDNNIYISTVFVNGEDVGLTQIAQGMAWYFKPLAYDRTPDLRKRYADAQAKAMADRLGLWKDNRPIPPWIFRGEYATEIERQPEPQNAAANAPANQTTATEDKDRKYLLGPMGGCYYVSESGRKVYVKDKSLCQPAATVGKP